jgi:hypothetical protein
MGQFAQYLIRTAVEDDIFDIASMREEVLGWPRREDYIASAVSTGHGVGAYAEGKLVGFRY